MARNNLITVRTGSKAGIKAIVDNITNPTAVGYNNSQILGEPFLATDSKELFIGNGGGSPKVISPGVCVEDFDTLTPQNRANLYVYAYDTSLAADAPRSKKIALSELLTLVSNNSGDTCKVKIGLDTDTSGFLDAKTFGTNGVAIATSGTTNKMLNFQVVPDGATLSVSSSGIKVATGGITLNELATGIDASSKSLISKGSRETFINATAPTPTSGYAALYDAGTAAINILWSSDKIKKELDKIALGMNWVSITFAEEGIPGTHLPTNEIANVTRNAIYMDNPGISSYGEPIPVALNSLLYIYNAAVPTYNSANWVAITKNSGTALVNGPLGATTIGELFDKIFVTDKQNIFVVSKDFSSTDTGESVANMYYGIRDGNLGTSILALTELGNPEVGAGNALNYSAETNRMNVTVLANHGLGGGQTTVGGDVGGLYVKLTTNGGLAVNSDGIYITSVIGGTV